MGKVITGIFPWCNKHMPPETVHHINKQMTIRSAFDYTVKVFFSQLVMIGKLDVSILASRYNAKN